METSTQTATSAMFTDEQALELWKELTSSPRTKSLDELIPLFAISVLHQWGWPVRPKETKLELPPREETFLGYFDDIGWTTDWWGANFQPCEDEIPRYWMPLSVLPIPYRK